MNQFFQCYIGIVTFDDLSTGLEGLQNFPDTFQFLRLYFAGFVQQDDVAEFNLLDNQIFNIFFIYVVSGQFFTTGKFTLQTEGVNNSSDAVQTTDSTRLLPSCTSRLSSVGHEMTMYRS